MQPINASNRELIREYPGEPFARANAENEKRAWVFEYHAESRSIVLALERVLEAVR